MYWILSSEDRLPNGSRGGCAAARDLHPPGGAASSGVLAQVYGREVCHRSHVGMVFTQNVKIYQK